MQTFFVEIKCKLGKTYEVASELADREIASEIYSTAGNYDILAKFHVAADVDIGHFVAEKVQSIPEIADTHTIITFKAFGSFAPAALEICRIVSNACVWFLASRFSILPDCFKFAPAPSFRIRRNC